MSSDNSANSYRITEASVREDLQRQPHIFMRLAENALTVAESLRGNYFKNTAKFVAALRKAMLESAQGKRSESVLDTYKVDDLTWAHLQNEVVTFIDGGVGEVNLSNQIPVLLRVGSYCVRTGERQISEREQFGYYPVILGDLEGGSKERKDFIDIVRITAELLGGLSALERTPDLRVLMFHGPLVYLVGSYAGHTPFTERDIDIFLNQYAASPDKGRQIKEDFLRQAKLDIYPELTSNSDEWVRRRIFEPLCFMAYLFRRLIQEAQTRKPVPIIAGVVERGMLREFSLEKLLPRVFRGLREKQRENYFNEMYGRTDLTSPQSLLDRLGYTDSLLLAMLLQPGQCSESWEVAKYNSLNRGEMSLPGATDKVKVKFSALRDPRIGFPHVRACYVDVSETTEPVRIEVFDELGQDQIIETARRVYLYSRLLPGYGFPVGLDIADKYSHVPDWLTNAYSKLIRQHLGESLQRGDISDAEMRRILVQAIYMTHRDWLFRPNS